MMKKSLTYLAVAGAFAAAGSAQAALNLQNDGIGHILLVPYFTTQNGNATLLNLVNTDTVNAKAVKVRFRGGRDSDDIFDFQVFLSPGDVWTTALTQAASGVTQMSVASTENSCTLPAKSVLNSTPFVTGRLSTADATNGVGTREGYVEIFNMADIIPSSTLFATVKHTSTGGAPTCSTTILEAIEASHGTALAAPSTGLMANWTIINVPNTTAYSGVATAIEADSATRVVYSAQTATAVTATTASTSFPTIASTFDGVLLTTGFQTAKYDFPDVSTPYEVSTASAGTQIYNVSSTIAHTNLINEFVVETGISASTDWLVSMPTRRYFVSGRGTASTGASAGAGTYAGTVALIDSRANTLAASDVCANETIAAYGSCTYVGNGTTAKEGAQGYFRGVTTYAADGRSSCTRIGGYTIYDREEQTQTGSNVVISPNTITTVSLCGGINVLSMNNATANTPAVGANLIVQGLSVPYQNGWATVRLNEAGKSGGLPVIGYAFVKAVNPAVAAGVSGTFGGTWAHRWANGTH